MKIKCERACFVAAYKLCFIMCVCVYFYRYYKETAAYRRYSKGLVHLFVVVIVIVTFVISIIKGRDYYDACITRWVIWLWVAVNTQVNPVSWCYLLYLVDLHSASNKNNNAIILLEQEYFSSFICMYLPIAIPFYWEWQFLKPGHSFSFFSFFLTGAIVKI